MRKLKLNEQSELLRYCKTHSKKLSSELEKLGLSYDSLVYESNKRIDNLLPEFSLKYKTLSEFKKRKKDMPLVSFFSGCGGLDLGFEFAGFKTVAMIEISEIFCNTLRDNFSTTVIGPPEYNGDVRDTDAIIEILKSIGIKENFPGVFVGGPPCQPFSIAANQRFSKNGEKFKRIGFDHKGYGNLLFDYIFLVKTFRPKAFLIENVEGLLTLDGGRQVSEACQILARLGYTVVKPTLLNAANFFIPQNRWRVFIVGVIDGSFQFPQKQFSTVSCGKALEKSVDGLANNETREHKAESIERYMKLDYGKRDKLGRVDRLNPMLPSKTVIAGGTKGGGRSHLHPHIPRTMSVRECARLQTFPDDFVFTGSPARQFTQVGNAVPPILAYHLAGQIFKGLNA